LLKKTQLFWISLAVFIVFLTGCSTHKRIQNLAMESPNPEVNYQIKEAGTSGPDDIFIALSFSGGGTRAAAFSYGLLSELRDTHIRINGRDIRLLDEVDLISSVSGGSFTAAYYGLFGEKIFDDFETVFLKKDVQKTLIDSIINPVNWFNLLSPNYDRSTLAAEYYDKTIFKGMTFSNMMTGDGPSVHINATDLGTGQPFVFTQDSFDLLCSDLSEYKVAMAVAASSAVPVVFPPITLKNYPDCQVDLPGSIDAVQHDTTKDIRIRVLAKDISSYLEKDRRKYIHLVDGGIADNLGFRSIFSHILLRGNAGKKSGGVETDPVKLPRHFVMIVVNAETEKSTPMELSPASPSSEEVAGVVIHNLLSRYSLETISQAEKLFKDTVSMISGSDQPVCHFIELKFNDIHNPKVRKTFNSMATSLTLPNDQVDMLYKSARKLLRDSRKFQEFLETMKQ